MGLLDEISGAECELLLNAARRKTFKNGAEIIRHGEESTDVYFLTQGAAIATLISIEGRFVAYRTIRPGDVFGELAALSAAPRNAWIHAKGPAVVHIIAYDKFESLLREAPELAIALSRHLARMVSELTERVFERSAMVVRQRLGRELVRRAVRSCDSAIIAELPPHAELAAFIGTHREAVTKELSALHREGLISRQGRRVAIPSLTALHSALADEGDWA